MFLAHPNDLKYFIELSKRGNLSRAAESLGVQQPTLSLAVRRLEEGFGQTLLLRDKRGVRLTEEGKSLLDFASEILSLYEKSRIFLSKGDTQLSGVLRIGCHPSVARYALPSTLKELLHRHPKIKAELVHDISRRIQSLLLEQKLDCALVMNSAPHPDLIQIPILDDWMGVYGSPSNTNLDVLILDPDLHQSQEILRKLDRGRFRRLVESSNLEVIARMVHEGCGYGILPQRVASLLTQPKLSPIAQSPKVKDQLFLCYLVQNKKNPAIQEFKSILKEKSS